MERVVPDPPRIRSQASQPFGRSASQRFQHTRASRPCFVPRPSLGFALQSLPLAGSRDPSRGPLCSLAVIHQRADQRGTARPSRPVSPTPAPSPEGARGGLDPRTAISELSAGNRRGHSLLPARPWSRDLRQPYRQLHPLRSFDPPASPFAPTATGLPRIRPRVTPEPPRNDPLRSRPIAAAGRCSPELHPSRDVLEARVLRTLTSLRPPTLASQGPGAGVRTLVRCATQPRPHGDPCERDLIGCGLPTHDRSRTRVRPTRRTPARSP